MELINIRTKKWPVTLAQFKEAHPHTHLPDDPEILAQIDWQDFGYAILTEDEKPAFDPLTQALEPEIKVKNKAHKKGWKVVSLPAQDAAANIEAARIASIPHSLTRRQFKLALIRLGLFETVENMVAASDDLELRVTYQEAQDFERNHPMILQMAESLGKTDADLDDLFILGGTL